MVGWKVLHAYMVAHPTMSPRHEIDPAKHDFHDTKILDKSVEKPFFSPSKLFLAI
jgi:hypothetical protein